MDRPIETRSKGEIVATSFRITPLAAGWVLLQPCFDEEDGDVYECARIVMPRSVFVDLQQLRLPPSRVERVP